MATHSAALFWGGVRHPVRSVLQRLSKRAPVASDSSAERAADAAYRCQSPERLERIAAYAWNTLPACSSYRSIFHRSDSGDDDDA